MSTEAYPVLVALLFAVGAFGFLLYHNAIIAFTSVGLMPNTVNLVLVTSARQHGKLDGQVALFFVAVAVVAEVVVGLAIIVVVYRARRSASVDDANLLKF